MALSTIPFSGLGADASKQGINFRNLIINGDMSIAQRGTSSTGVTGNGYYTVDRMVYTRGATTTPTWTLEQSTDVPSGQGFSYSFKGTVTTSHTIAADSVAFFSQKIEAQNLQQLNYGTSNAKTLTLSFWVKSNVTGTYIISLVQSDASKYLPASVTINSANTWEKKSVSFIGDIAGTINNDNGDGLSLRFIMFAGTSYTSGTLATTWQDNSNNTDKYVGQVDVASTTSNYWQVTGVQLEVGTSASDFEFLPYDVNLLRCQRYCYAWGNYGQGSSSENNKYCSNYSSISSFINIQYPTQMRAEPTVTYTPAGGAASADYSTPSGLQLYDSDDTNWNIYDVLAEAEL